VSAEVYNSKQTNHLYAKFISLISCIYRTHHYDKYHRRCNLFLAILPRPSNSVSSFSNLSPCTPSVCYRF